MVAVTLFEMTRNKEFTTGISTDAAVPGIWEYFADVIHMELFHTIADAPL
jgi:hypothetical protein